MMPMPPKKIVDPNTIQALAVVVCQNPDSLHYQTLCTVLCSCDEHVPCEAQEEEMPKIIQDRI